MTTAVVDSPVRRRPKVCIVGSGTVFLSGISYYTFFLTQALNARVDVVAILMRHLIPRRFYPGRERVGADLTGCDVATEVPTFNGVDWWAWPSVPRAVSFLRRERPDVLVLQWWSASVLPWYLLLARQAAKLDCDLVVELHEDVDTGEARIPFVGALARRGLRWLCERANVCIVHSEWDRERIPATLGLERADRFHVIPHGPFPVAPPPQRTAIEDADDITLLFFGTIRPYKGLEHLVEAFDRLPREHKRWRLLVVGETWEGWTRPLQLIEESSHRDEIELVNRYVTDAEAAAFFARADIVVLPYLRSSASGPLAITKASGLPVVITDVGGLAEAVEGYSGAVLARAGDPTDLANAIVSAIALRGRRHQTDLTWEDLARSYLDLLDDSLAGRSRATRTPEYAA